MFIGILAAVPLDPGFDGVGVFDHGDCGGGGVVGVDVVVCCGGVVCHFFFWVLGKGFGGVSEVGVFVVVFWALVEGRCVFGWALVGWNRAVVGEYVGRFAYTKQQKKKTTIQIKRGKRKTSYTNPFPTNRLHPPSKHSQTNKQPPPSQRKS